MTSKIMTKEEIIKKYTGKYIDLYRCDGKLYEVRGVSNKIRENYNTPEYWFTECYN